MMHPVRGRTRTVVSIAAITAIVVGSSGKITAREQPSPSGRRSPAHETVSSDTVVVYGPKAFVIERADIEQEFIEQVAFELPLDRRRFFVRIEPTRGSASPKSATVRIDGAIIYRLTGADSGQGVVLIPIDSAWETSSASPARIEGIGRRLTRAANAARTASRTLTIQATASGPVGASVIVSVVALRDPSYVIYGPRTFTKGKGQAVEVLDTVIVPATATAPFSMVVVNGGSDGTRRTTSADIALDSKTIVKSSDLNGGTTRVAKAVLLEPGKAAALGVTVRGAEGSSLTVSLTATDVTPPRVVVTTPAENAVTKDLQVTVSGSVEDETIVQVTVNGVQATVTPSPSSTAFSAKIPLNAEGANTLTITAEDAAGLQTVLTRKVIRDTQAPVLVLSSPGENFITNTPTLNIAGTVTDLTSVALNVNGIPATPDVSGAFTGSITLVEGANFAIVTATDAAGNSTSLTRQAVLDTKPPVLAVTAPAEGSTTAEASVAVSGTVSDASSVGVTINGTAATVANGSYTGTASVVVGANTITVKAIDAATNVTTVTRQVTRTETSSNLPPDPSTVAPPVNRTVATTVGSSTTFLYSGENPIQTGVAPGTIKQLQAAIVRGRLLVRDGGALSGVMVTVLDHPEYGQTRSRSDGRYDLAVNGGGLLTLVFEKTGYLPAQRQVNVPWRDYRVLDDVAMVPLDGKVTAVALAGSAQMQVVEGSTATDADGSRKATVLFPAGTQATLEMLDGTTKSLPAISVRATELTVGPNGPAAMAAALPPQSAYTYAVELSVDEAQQPGAKDVRFSQPVPTYVENFIGFPVGTAVPAGYYDRQQGKWIAGKDGRVIKILSIVGGAAQLDIDGNGSADDATSLASIGITNVEQQTLALKYTVGVSLWRVPIDHFSFWDFNWPFGFPKGARGPTDVAQASAEKQQSTNECDKSCGSILEIQNQTLGERIGIVGTPYALNYRSDRVPGWRAGSVLRIPVTGPSVPDSLKRVELDISIAGQSISRIFPSVPNQIYVFEWDGKDAYGRAIVGAQTATVRVSYVYRLLYYGARSTANGGGGGSAPLFDESFAGIADSPLNVSRSTGEAKVFQEYQVTIPGAWDARAQSIGGWTLDPHHSYDPERQTLHLGTGAERTVSTLGSVVSTVAGTGVDGSPGGDGGPGVDAQLSVPIGLVNSPDGSLYFSEYKPGRIRRIAPNGIITTIAGIGGEGYNGDGIPAKQAILWGPHGISLGPDGSMYIADYFNNRIRKIDPQGIITTVIGSSREGFSGDGGPASQALMHHVALAVIGPDGALYFGDLFNRRIRRIDSKGIITTIAGTGVNGFNGDGIPATKANLEEPYEVRFGPDGTLYFTDFLANRIRKIGTDGIITTVAGTGQFFGPLGDGGLATAATTPSPANLVIGPDGSLYFTSGADGNGRIRKITPNGIISTIAGVGPRSELGDGGPAVLAGFYGPSDMAFAPNGSIFVSDHNHHRIREIAPSLPGFSSSEFAVSSEDGLELYIFGSEGQHIRTVNTLTGANEFSFGYDASGRLASITDRDNRVTQIERDAGGNPVAIVAPSGERTKLTTSSNGYLATVADPADQVTRLTYDAVGLLTEFQDPRGNVSKLTYDGAGHLRSDGDAAGATQLITDLADAEGHTVTLTSGEKTASKFRVQSTADGGTIFTNTATDGTISSTTIGADGGKKVTAPDGTTTTRAIAGDPRFSLMAPVLSNASVQLPSGLTMNVMAGRQATLATKDNPLSLITLRDSVVVNGRKSLSVFDAAQRLFTTTSPEGRTSQSKVDALGRITEVTIPGVAATSYGYDARGNLTSAVQGNRTWRYEYDDAGRVTKITDPLLQSTRFGYDAAGRATKQTLADGRVVELGYDAAGNVTSVTPPGRPSHKFEYNKVNLPVAYNPPAVTGGGSTAYAYNLDRRLTKVTRPDNKTIDFGYDAGGRVSTVTTGTRQLTYGYSAAGKVESITDGSAGGTSTRYTYDGALPKSETWTGAVNGTVAVQYDNNLRVASQTVNGALGITLGYDNDGMLTSAGSLTLTRNPQNGLLSGTTLAGVTTARTYSSFGELESEQANFNGTVLFQTKYTRDGLGRITTLEETTQGVKTTHGYEYDAAGHLVQVVRNGNVAAKYSYDDNGNRLSRITTNGVEIGTYDDQDRLTTYAAATYTYTPNGELLSKTEGASVTRYAYDEFGNSRSVTLGNGMEVSYAIDAQQRRVGRYVNGTLVQGFLYSGHLAPVAELNGAGQVVSRFVYGTHDNVPDYVVKGGVTYRFVLDQAGSVRLVVNAATGAVAQQIDYDVFGNVTTNTNPGFQPFAFAGGLYDNETQLVRFGARDYDPRTGRWTTRDRASADGGDLNSYVYSSNDPANRIDSEGYTDVRITVTRDLRTSLTTQGTIRVTANGELLFEGFSLEPSGTNQARPRVAQGDYEGSIYHSPHFGHDVLLLRGTDPLSYVEFHPGNTWKDTKACILPGTGRQRDRVSGSGDAFDMMMLTILGTMALDATRGEATNITIRVW